MNMRKLGLLNGGEGKDWFSMPAMCISQTQLVTQPSTPNVAFKQTIFHCCYNLRMMMFGDLTRTFKGLYFEASTGSHITYRYNTKCSQNWKLNAN